MNSENTGKSYKWVMLALLCATYFMAQGTRQIYYSVHPDDGGRLVAAADGYRDGVLGFATGVYDSNLYAALLDVVEPRYRAVSTGLFGLGGCVVGATGAVAIAIARFRYFKREVIPHSM